MNEGTDDFFSLFSAWFNSCFSIVLIYRLYAKGRKDTQTVSNTIKTICIFRKHGNCP